MSFENDTEGKIDTTEIKEEDWIDYIKRSTNDALERWEMRRFNVGTRLTKNEIEIGDENCNITE